ncbi:MAG TPA: type II secretion system F family protein [Acidimicrobiales bacterium]|jgi:tight adherence protein C|nr:type II secretion system F family protein [Acidimicrobiales bacterium]
MNAVIRRFRRPDQDAVEYLQELEADELEVGDYEAHLSQPFLTRIVRPMGERGLKAISSLTPSNYLDSVHKKLLLAGMASTVRAEEFVTAQAALTLFSALAAVALVLLTHPPSNKAVLFLVLLPTMGALFPAAWLNRKVSERKLMILRDLPDTLDLLAISVEAGMGFEGALEVVCQNFTSPLADEFSRTLREMELGLPRRDAFQNLKRRTEVPELSNFVLALLQADALGIPIGRVLKTQAAEMRNKRRQWAREKAGKLPVKIMFPLVCFIFPAVLVIVLGPAGSSIGQALR